MGSCSAYVAELHDLLDARLAVRVHLEELLEVDPVELEHEALGLREDGRAHLEAPAAAGAEVAQERGLAEERAALERSEILLLRLVVAQRHLERAVEQDVEGGRHRALLQDLDLGA